MKRGERDGVWEEMMEVHSYDVGLSGRLSLDTALKFFQEAAWHHAEHLGVGYTHLRQRNQVWLLSRITVIVESLPVWGRQVLLRTWPRGPKSLLALRDFEMLDGEGRRFLGGTSGWLVFDFQSRRPQRLEPVLGHIRTFPELRSVGCDPEKIPDSESGSNPVEIAVKYGDLDQNDHVNNTTYVRWLLDSYSVEFHRSHVVRSASVNFLAELGAEDAVLLTSRETSPLVMRHTIRRRIDDAESCRAVLVWRE